MDGWINETCQFLSASTNIAFKNNIKVTSDHEFPFPTISTHLRGKYIALHTTKRNLDSTVTACIAD